MNRDEMVAAARGAMFDELDRQHENCEIDAAGYWDREWGRCDGEPKWDKVAAAAVDAVLASMSPPF